MNDSSMGRWTGWVVAAIVAVIVVGCGGDDVEQPPENQNQQGWNVGGNSGDINDPNDNNDGTDQNTNDPTEPAVDEVQIEPSTVTLAVGDTNVLESSVFDEEGDEIEDVQLQWESHDPTVATVDERGRVTAVAHGQVVITAEVDGVYGEATVTVEEVTWRQVVAGHNTSCAVTWDGDVVCWGNDLYGLTGERDFTELFLSTPTPVVVPIDVEGIAVGATHYCGWNEQGDTYCWGFNAEGQLAVPATEQVLAPTSVGGKSFVDIDAGIQHTCGIDEEGGAYCWGTNEFGELGTSGIERSSEPVEVLVDEPVVDVAAGWMHSCAVGESSSVYCWGRNFTGAISPQMPADQVLLPTEVSLAEGIEQVEVGLTSTCGLTLSNTVKCWGMGTRGELGRGGIDVQVHHPDYIDTDETYVDLSTTTHTVCGVREDDTIDCWGDNRFGAVGDASGQDRGAPTEINGQWKQVSVGQTHACGIREGDTIQCWGGNDLGAVGDGRTMAQSHLQPVEGGADEFDALYAGAHLFCGVDAEREHTYCWGRNESMQQQRERPGTLSTPERLPEWAPATMALGDGFACGLEKAQGQPEPLQCWGSNEHGRLGIDTAITNSTRHPVEVDTDEEFVTVEAGATHACGIAEQGDAYCWGDNTFGQIGATDGTTHQEQPRHVDIDDTSFEMLAASHTHTCALSDEGQVWCWGANEFGQLGSGQPTDLEGPVMVDYDHQFVAIDADNSITCGLSVDGDVVCWGNGGQLTGNPDTVFSESPRVFEGNWDAIAMSDQLVCAVEDETLHCGGWDIDGWLGSPVPAAINDLAEIDEEVSVTEVVVENRNVCVLDDDGQALCRGTDAFGSLGLGSSVDYLEPQTVAMPD